MAIIHGQEFGEKHPPIPIEPQDPHRFRFNMGIENAFRLLFDKTEEEDGTDYC